MSERNFLKTVKVDKKEVGSPVTCTFKSLVDDGKTYIISYSIVGDKFLPIKKMIELSSLDELDKKSDELINKFLSDCVKISLLYKKKESVKFFFHDLSNFSGYLLSNHAYSILKTKVDFVSRSGFIYKLSFKFKEVSLVFQDSSILIPLSTVELASLFYPEYLNYNPEEIYLKHLIRSEFVSFRENYLNFCLSESKLMNKVYCEVREVIFNSFFIDCFKLFSMSNVSSKLLRLTLPEVKIENTHRNDNKKSYFSYCYKDKLIGEYNPKITKDNSYKTMDDLYLNIMYKYEYPVGFGIWTGGSRVTFENIDSFFGFVSLINIDTKNSNLIGPINKTFGIFFSEEAKMAKKLGCTFEVSGSAIEYKRGFIFKEFLNVISELKKKDPKNDAICQLLVKNLFPAFDDRLSEIDVNVIDTFDQIEATTLKKDIQVNEAFEIIDSLVLDSALLIKREVSVSSNKNTIKYEIKSELQLRLAIRSYIRMEVWKHQASEF